MDHLATLICFENFLTPREGCKGAKVHKESHELSCTKEITLTGLIMAASMCYSKHKKTFIAILHKGRCP
jgi:hypothetical protein